jgi:hypothetical protein
MLKHGSLLINNNLTNPHIKLVHHSQTRHITEYVDVYSPLLYTPGCPRCNHCSGEDEVVKEDFQEFQEYDEF